ncbi:ankyrin repeat-containing domain protein [Mycena rosella]|uniref:Ankyrin repeat-containing domain protein n=1 Tax=Mycena rosella TaxID=1033263 RepID=A0AAD7DTU4_MYCRO|nr:ankyrin repeat-containing domain protein [Mycena rosella]
MSTNCFDELPPELVLLLPRTLSLASLNALVRTCRRLREILQPELESRLSPQLGRKLLLWAAPWKPHIITKLLSPPHSISPNGYGFFSPTPLHVAAKARNRQIASLLLAAGADPAAEWDQDEYQALHLAMMNRDLDMMRLLLDHGAPIDAMWGADGCSENVLQAACSMGHMEMIHLLLDRGASLEVAGHFGTALGFAVHRDRLDVVQLLLERGADASVTVPLFILLAGGPPQPHSATLLYIAMRLRHPADRRMSRQAARPKWEGLPLGEDRKRMMALLMAHGASKDGVLETISKHLSALAKEAQHTEEEYLAVIKLMLTEAEDGMPDVLPE